MGQASCSAVWHAPSTPSTGFTPAVGGCLRSERLVRGATGQGNQVVHPTNQDPGRESRQSGTTSMNLAEQPPAPDFTGTNVLMAEASAEGKGIRCHLCPGNDLQPSRFKGEFASRGSRTLYVAEDCPSVLHTGDAWHPLLVAGRTESLLLCCLFSGWF